MKKLLILINLILLISNGFLGYKIKTEVIDYTFTPPKFPAPTVQYDQEILYKYDKYVKFIYLKEDKKYVKYLNYKDISSINILNNGELFLLVFKDKSGEEYSLIYKNRLEVLATKYLIKKNLNEGVFVVDISKYDFIKGVKELITGIKKGTISINEPMSDTNIPSMISDELKNINKGVNRNE